MACQSDELTKKIIGTSWIRSFEDDKKELLAYRPDTYDFPLARGRTGVKFFEDNTLIHQEIRAADGFVDRKGTWKLSSQQSKDKNPLVQVNLEALPSNYQNEESFQLELVSVSDSIIWVRKIE